MKKKILGLIGAIAIIALMVFNTQFINNSNSGNFTLSSLVMQAFANCEGETVGTSGECCQSSTLCLMHYTTYVNWQGERFCCSSSVQGAQGKAKA